MSILAEDSINTSVPKIEQNPDNNINIKPLLSDIESIIDSKIEHFFVSMLRNQIQRINDLEEKVEDLEETIEKQNHILKTLGLNAVGGSEVSYTDNMLSANELRAEKVFSELVKVQKLNSSTILNICKLNHKDHRTAHRIMDLAVRMFPDQCQHDVSTVTGQKKHWLSLISSKDV